mmetsp:Transcript_6305/g.18772  ORF Transcript_6305/g.18772 Transcript_6305/m.18772 type:complete len:387 (-) Transcript_6305:69-1229(-)
MKSAQGSCRAVPRGQPHTGHRIACPMPRSSSSCHRRVQIPVPMRRPFERHLHGQRPGARAHPREAARLHSERVLDLVVEHEHESAANRAYGVRACALEHGAEALVGEDLCEAVHGALVKPLVLGLLALHLQAAADRVEGVRRVAGGDGHALGDGELGEDAHNAVVVLEGVLLLGRVEEAEVDTAVGDDANHRHAEAVVETHEAAGALGSLHEAVDEAVELCLAGSDVRGETSTRVVEGVDHAEGARARKAARRHVDGKVGPELRLRVRLGEEALDRVLEGEVEGLRREITNDVGQVAAPESAEALLLVDADKAVRDSRVALHLARDNLRVRILSLDEELHALNGSRARLRDRARHAADGEVLEEASDRGLLLRRRAEGLLLHRREE